MTAALIVVALASGVLLGAAAGLFTFRCRERALNRRWDAAAARRATYYYRGLPAPSTRRPAPGGRR